MVPSVSMPSATSTTRSWKWMPSIMTTARSSSSSRRRCHASSCCWLSATKRRDTALLDVAMPTSGGGNLFHRRRANELAAVRQARMHVFALTSGNLSADVSAEVLLAAWPAIKRAVVDTEPPMLWSITRGGVVRAIKR
jgi:hypothetical protein